MNLEIENAPLQTSTQPVEFSTLVCTVIERLFEDNPSQNGKVLNHTVGYMAFDGTRKPRLSYFCSLHFKSTNRYKK